VPIQLDGERYLLAKEVVDEVGISRQTLWRWRQCNLVPLGRRFRDSQLLFTCEEAEVIRNYANRLRPADEGVVIS